MPFQPMSSHSLAGEVRGCEAVPLNEKGFYALLPSGFAKLLKAGESAPKETTHWTRAGLGYWIKAKQLK
jgi:hypothetical protein